MSIFILFRGSTQGSRLRPNGQHVAQRIRAAISTYEKHQTENESSLSWMVRSHPISCPPLIPSYSLDLSDPLVSHSSSTPLSSLIPRGPPLIPLLGSPPRSAAPSSVDNQALPSRTFRTPSWLLPPPVPPWCSSLPSPPVHLQLLLALLLNPLPPHIKHD